MSQNNDERELIELSQGQMNDRDWSPDTLLTDVGCEIEKASNHRFQARAAIFNWSGQPSRRGHGHYHGILRARGHDFISALRPHHRWFLLCFLFFNFFAGPKHLTAQVVSILQGTIKDPQNLAIKSAEITLSGPVLAGEIKVTSDATGSYRIPGLQAGTYSLQVAKPSFATKVYRGLAVTVNRSLVFDVVLTVSPVQEEVTVSALTPLIDPTSSSSGTTILPQQIEQMPINGRNYLDLMQLVPGIAVNRRVDVGTDAAAPVLGERGGNAIFLIDGMPNKNSVDGGPAAPFDQDSILEFQVLTSGYKAEFGHGSGGVVNVVSKSGTSQWHGLISAFHRNNALDSRMSRARARRFCGAWTPNTNLGGPIVKDRIYFFGSLERIRETRTAELHLSSRCTGFSREPRGDLRPS